MGENAKFGGFVAEWWWGAEITVFSLKVTVYKATIQKLSQTLSSKPSDLDRKEEWERKVCAG